MITLSIDRGKSPIPVLPVDYQYPLSCWIYKILRNGHPDFKGWLQKRGYTSSKQVFKMFNFSHFLLAKGESEVRNDRLMLLAGEIRFIFSSCSKDNITDFVTGLFGGQELSLGDKKSRVFFVVKSVEEIHNEIAGEKTKLRMLTPVVISNGNGEDNTVRESIDPADKDFKKLFFEDLLTKYRSIWNGVDDSPGDTSEFTLELLSVPIKKEIVVKAGTPEQISITGYQFNFAVNAPSEIVKTGLNAGFGVMNNLGFGCCDLIEDEDPLYLSYL